MRAKSKRRSFQTRRSIQKQAEEDKKKTFMI
jgi:hypothetical protein